MSIAALLQSKISTDKDDVSDIKSILEKKKLELENEQKKAIKSEKIRETAKKGSTKYINNKREEGFKQCVLFIKKEYLEQLDKDIKNTKKIKKPTRSDLINKMLQEKYGNEIQ